MSVRAYLLEYTYEAESKLLRQHALPTIIETAAYKSPSAIVLLIQSFSG